MEFRIGKLKDAEVKDVADAQAMEESMAVEASGELRNHVYAKTNSQGLAGPRRESVDILTS
jgi:hypothetical protein